MKFFDALALLLIAFKITHIIDISWVWVLSPIWIQILISGILKAIANIKIKKFLKKNGDEIVEDLTKFCNLFGDDK